MKKLLILGASGLIGKALIEECKDDFDVYGTYFSTTSKLPDDKQYQLELQQLDKLKEIVRSIKPDIIVSCLRGDFDQQLEFHKQLALEIQSCQTNLYFLSTANVFDGDFSRIHTEIDMPNANSDYGKYKIECEKTLTQILDERVSMIRIPAIWGKESPRMRLIKESIEKNQVIDVFSNLECNNLLDTQLAKQLRFIFENELKGIFHFGSVDRMTQGEFFEKVIKTISAESNILKFNLYEDTEDTFYFGLSSIRNDIPDTLKSTNESILSYLVD